MLFLLFLFEMGLDLYVQLALDYAVQEGARELQTGAGNAALSLSAFQTNCLCPKVAGLLNCNQISLNIAPMTSADYYTNAVAGTGSIPMSAGGLDTSGFAFTPGGPDTPMFMQAIYTSVSAVGLLLPMMSVKYGSSRVHVTNSTIGFVNEPFSSSNTVCGVQQGSGP